MPSKWVLVVDPIVDGAAYAGHFGVDDPLSKIILGGVLIKTLADYGFASRGKYRAGVIGSLYCYLKDR